MDAFRLDPTTPAWNTAIADINARLHAGHNPSLLPNQFVQVVVPKLGGETVWLREGDQEIGVGFLLPRMSEAGQSARRAYTLRYHPVNDAGRPTPELAQAVTAAVGAQLPDSAIHFYDPTTLHQYAPTYRDVGGINIGRPSAEEAAQIPQLQQEIWGSTPEFLYPADLHSVEFALGNSLVARAYGQLAAFLFGFHKFDGPPLPADWGTRFRGDLRLESQTLGVLPAFRGMRIANLLKKAQAEEAWAAGIGVVNWTADPLQFPNAALNFGLLRALAFHFYPDFYPFRNALNRVPASRFGLTWLVGSARAQNVPLSGGRAIILDLPQHPEIRRVNQGYANLDFDARAAHIAIEIPGNWTLMQAEQEAEAARWRDATDRLFSHYVGAAPGQYVITGVATDHEQHFLIAQRVDDALLEHFGHVEEG